MATELRENSQRMKKEKNKAGNGVIQGGVTCELQLLPSRISTSKKTSRLKEFSLCHVSFTFISFPPSGFVILFSRTEVLFLTSLNCFVLMLSSLGLWSPEHDVWLDSVMIPLAFLSSLIVIVELLYWSDVDLPAVRVVEWCLRGMVRLGIL